MSVSKRNFFYWLMPKHLFVINSKPTIAIYALYSISKTECSISYGLFQNKAIISLIIAFIFSLNGKPFVTESVLETFSIEVPPR